MSLLTSNAQDGLIHRKIEVLNNKACIQDSLIDWQTLKVIANEKQLFPDMDFRVIDSIQCLFVKGNYKVVDVSYRKFVVDELDSFYNKDRRRIISEIKGDFDESNNFNRQDEYDPFDLFAGSQLKTYGNLSRGLGFGNNQNLVVNSNLNLQLSGDIANDIEFLAAISDESNPIQPEGNTQQLQDFDRAFFKFIRGNNSLILGDFLLESNPENYFLKYNKKSQGISYSAETKLNGGKFFTTASATKSRGRFSRNIINGIEGNQGPYQLRGQNGEIFILILSGTEKIYLDGKLLTRGENFSISNPLDPLVKHPPMTPCPTMALVAS